MICVKGKVTVVTLLVLTLVTLVSDASEEFSDDSEEDVDQCDGEEAVDCAKVLKSFLLTFNEIESAMLILLVDSFFLFSTMST